MTRLRHYDDLGTARFVTFSTYRRLPTLIDRRHIMVILNYLDAARTKHGFRLLGYVIMPEHIHLVLHPPGGMKLGLVIREIKSRSARDIFSHAKNDPIASYGAPGTEPKAGYGTPGTIASYGAPFSSRNVSNGKRRVFWKLRCYDHNCRTPETVVEKIRYCHNNPVKRGLVASLGEWRWSSWGCYHGAEDVPLVVDVEEWYAAAVSN